MGQITSKVYKEIRDEILVDFRGSGRFALVPVFSNLSLSLSRVTLAGGGLLKG